MFLAKIMLLAQDTFNWGPLVVSFVVGGAVGLGAFVFYGKAKKKALTDELARLEQEARDEAEKIRVESEKEAKEAVRALRAEHDKEIKSERNAMVSEERDLRKRESNLKRKLEQFTKKEKMLDETEMTLTKKKSQLEEQEKKVQALLEEEKATLTRISGLTEKEATELLLKQLEKQMKDETADLITRVSKEAKEEVEDRAREILLMTLQRCAVEHTAATVVSHIELENDDIKGRIIGREGRNIKAFERATGVDVIVDDTPGLVLVSAFDPVRRETGKMALERLISDGRIHPTRIDEVVRDVRQEMNKIVAEKGKKSALEADVHGLHPKLVEYLGRLHFKKAAGLNPLLHSIQVSRIMGLLAGELSLDVQLARRIGLLHAIGMAEDHAAEGAYQKVGADICRRHNEPKDVSEAIAAQTSDKDVTGMYAILLHVANDVVRYQVKDKTEGIEKFIQRLEKLEQVALQVEGVKEAYAINSGKEMRVIVDVGKVEERYLAQKARQVAKAIERDMSFPGKVKVTLLRERRMVSVAH